MSVRPPLSPVDCMAALDRWAVRGEVEDPRLRAGIARAGLDEEDARLYRAGRAELWTRGPAVDAPGLTSATLTQPGLAAAGIVALLLASSAPRASRGRRDADEIARYVALALAPADDAAERLVRRLREVSPPSSSSAPRAEPTSRASRPVVSRRVLLGAGLGVALLALGARALLRGGDPEPQPVSGYQGLIPVSALVRTPGRVVARLKPEYDRLAPEEQERGAVELWRRLRDETDDPGLELVLESRPGRPFARVLAGRVSPMPKP